MLRRLVEWAFSEIIAEIRRETWADSRQEAVRECQAVIRAFPRVTVPEDGPDVREHKFCLREPEVN